jgi:hypothetical protein
MDAPFNDRRLATGILAPPLRDTHSKRYRPAKAVTNAIRQKTKAIRINRQPKGFSAVDEHND